MRMRAKTLRVAVVVFLATVLLAGVAVISLGVVGGLQKLRDLTGTAPTYSAVELATRAAEQQRAGDVVGAEALYQQALAQDAKLEYRAQLALVKYRLKKYEEAITNYQELIKAQTNQAFAWNGMGNAYRDWAASTELGREQRLIEAERAYRNAIAADSGYVVAYTNLAIFLDDSGKTQEAVNIAKQGLEATKRDELSQLIKRLENKL
jgi:tetratricopeptide (TPR) repeat protein